jgi:5-methyltetrahydrofolate--homocysteine methyltransferase
VPDLAQLTHAIEAGDRRQAPAITREALQQGVEPQTILDAMTAAMEAVGERFSAGEIYTPEMLVSARAMKEALVVLEPRLVGAGVRPIATAIIGTVEGDLHDIGKNLVAMMWKGAHIAVIDLGVDVTPQTFVAAVAEHRPSVVGLSALLTTTMPAMRTCIDSIRTAGHTAKIVVGGAPVTAAYASEIGADGYAPDAGSAARLIRDLVALPVGSGHRDGG